MWSNTIIFMILAAMLVVMSYGFKRATINAEGRLGTLERIVGSMCEQNPQLDGCATIKIKNNK